MNKKTNNDHAKIIDKKRTEMVENAKKYGVGSKQVLKKSKELDTLIYEYMKKNK